MLKSTTDSGTIPHPIPDLVIVDVTWYRTTLRSSGYTRVYPPPPPTPAIGFLIDLVNIGDSAYVGEPQIAFASAENDIRWENYPFVSNVEPKKINVVVGDTVVVCVAVPLSLCASNGICRFLLVTQQSMPQSMKSFDTIHFQPEERINNNVFDYSLK